ncbi:MAG: hypothetical protein GY820_10625 [Gammaproteobacteria bacterium]|nr:hypothetical protein [Gammaproteobacteria bacterium]
MELRTKELPDNGATDNGATRQWSYGQRSYSPLRLRATDSRMYIMHLHRTGHM